MKHIVKYFVVTFFLIISTNAFAEQKIVVLDLKFLMNNSKAGKGAQDYLKKSYADNVKKFTDIEKGLKKDEQDLLTKRAVMSKEDYAKSADALRKKVIDFQSARRAALDKIASQRAKSRETLLKSIDPILETYITENKIDLVISKQSTLGGGPNNDITSEITDKLNKILPSLNLK